MIQEKSKFKHYTLFEIDKHNLDHIVDNIANNGMTLKEAVQDEFFMNGIEIVEADNIDLTIKL